MKSLDLKEFLRFLCFSYDFRKSAWAGHLQNYCEKKHWVFDVFMFKCLQTQCVWYDFDMNARACTLLYFLQGMIAVDDRTSIASAPRGEMTSLDLTEFLRFLWFPMISARQPGHEICRIFVKKALGL